MKKSIFLFATTVFALNLCQGQNLQDALKSAAGKASHTLSSTTGTKGVPLSNDDVVKGLKEALTVGTNNSTALVSKLDGFYKNPAVFIPFPPQAQVVKETAVRLGMKPYWQAAQWYSTSRRRLMT